MLRVQPCNKRQHGDRFSAASRLQIGTCAGRYTFLTAPVNWCYKWYLYHFGECVMQVKFSEDVVPLSDLKVNPGKVVNRAQDTQRPILLTSRGRGVAVVQGLEEFERTAEELRFVKAVAQGLMDVREGNTVSLADAKKTLGIN